MLNITSKLNRNLSIFDFLKRSPGFDLASEEVNKIMKKFPFEHRDSAILPLLKHAQEKEGWVSESAMSKIAEYLGTPLTKVFETAMFYTMLKKQPTGIHHIECCRGLSCMLRGGDQILNEFENELGISCGEMTEDALFSIDHVECQGACSNAPVITVGGHYYEDLEIPDVSKIISSLRKGKTPKWGSLRGRKSSAPKGEKTSLFSEVIQKEVRNDL